MLLSVVFWFGVVAANHYFSDLALQDHSEDDGNITRVPRKLKISYDEEILITCRGMRDTSLSPFVVILLYKSSGRFVGMGSIISRTAVLSAGDAVRVVLDFPEDLLVLAGSRSPWWGIGSQIIPAKEILLTDQHLALINLSEGLIFGENVAPVRMMDEEVEDYKETFNVDNAIFGIYRSSFDAPGDYTQKAARYTMTIETMRDESNGLMECREHYPDRDFDEDYHICTSANGSYWWGCIGSPTVVINNKKPLQVAVVSKTARTAEEDIFHIHTKLSPYIFWLRSRSHLTYLKPKVPHL